MRSPRKRVLKYIYKHLLANLLKSCNPELVSWIRWKFSVPLFWTIFELGRNYESKYTKYVVSEVCNGFDKIVNIHTNSLSSSKRWSNFYMAIILLSFALNIYLLL